MPRENDQLMIERLLGIEMNVGICGIGTIEARALKPAHEVVLIERKVHQAAIIAIGAVKAYFIRSRRRSDLPLGVLPRIEAMPTPGIVCLIGEEAGDDKNRRLDPIIAHYQWGIANEPIRRRHLDNE